MKKPLAVQLLLGHTKQESTVRYLEIEVDDALEMAEQAEIRLCIATVGVRPSLTGYQPPSARDGFRPKAAVRDRQLTAKSGHTIVSKTSILFLRLCPTNGKVRE